MTAPRCTFHVGVDMVEIGASIAIADIDAPTMVNWRCPVTGCPHVAQSSREISFKRKCARCGEHNDNSRLIDRYCNRCHRYFRSVYEKGGTPARMLGYRMREKRRKLGAARTIVPDNHNPNWGATWKKVDRTKRRNVAAD